MRGLVSLSLVFALLLSAVCGCGSRERAGAPDKSNSGGESSGSSAEGFDTPDAALDAYGKALVDGDGAVYRKVAAKDFGAIAGLDAIIQFETGKSPEEAARINLQAMAPMQGFGDAVSKRFPAEITGDNAVIVQLFEREVAFKKEDHFRKFKFAKSGGKWNLVGSEFGDASELPEQYAWDKRSEVKAVDASAPTAMSFIPQDALAAVVVQPKRAATSEIGQALLELDVVQAGLEQSQFKPDDIDQIIYAIGVPTEGSENDCTIVQFTKAMSREMLLQEEFADLPYEEVQFQGVTYYRYAELDDGATRDLEANKENPQTGPEGEAVVLAKFPGDLQPNANGHADNSDSGNWFYYSSQTVNPTESNANLYKLKWSAQRKSYVSLRGKMGNDHPTVGNGLNPSPFDPHYAVLRWECRTTAEIQLRGNFKKFATATGSDGVQVMIFTDGEQKFSKNIKGVDTTGVDFDLSLSVKPGSMIDFVVDPSGSAHRDLTYLTATIEGSGEHAAAKQKLTDTPKKTADVEDDWTALGTAVFFPDEKTMVSTAEHRLQSLISGPPAQTPLTTKLSQQDLDYDLVAIVALEGYQDQIAELLAAMAEQTGSAELGGLSAAPQHAKFAIATIDLSGDTLLNLTVDAINEQSAGEVEGGFDSLLDALEGLRLVIPRESPMLPLVEQLVKGTTLKTTGLQVGLITKMPDGLADFLRNDAATAFEAITEISARPSDGVTGRDPDVAHEGDASGDNPKVVAYREPPKDHPDFRDLAVGSHDCRIFFPGEPEFTEDVVPIDEGDVHVANFRGATPRARYMFEIYTYPQAKVAKMGAKALLDETRDTLVDAPTGRLVSNKTFNFDDAPALDFVYEHPDVTGPGQAHCRVVIRGNRLYVMEVEGTQVPAAEISVFHDSLAPFALAGATATDSDSPPIVVTPKLPLPAQAARDETLQLVREVYEKEFQSAKKQDEKIALAKTMIARANETEATAERFVLLDVARKVAAGAGGIDAALSAIAQLDDEFEVDELQLTSEALLELANATSAAEDRIRVANEMLDAARLAVDADRYELAIGMLQQASTSARHARESKLAKTATDQLDETNRIKSQYEAIKPALESLIDNPDDAAANQATGEFYCLTKGQWNQGLPHLAKGNEANLKSAAEQELAEPRVAEQQAKLGDLWFELASAAEGLSEKHLQLRAAHWYRQALPNLAGLEKVRVEKRLSEMKHVVEAAGPKLIFLTDVPMLGAEGVLINDDKGQFREERLKGEKYPQVLWAHPQDKIPSHYAFTLNRKYSEVTGKAAINDLQSVARADKPQVFAVYGDKRLLWKSRPLQDKLDAQEFRVNVSNVRTLHLYVSGGGYGGHALWVDVSLEEKQ